MEYSVNEDEANQPLHSPPRRRRSTFFERRESFAPQTFSDNVDLNVPEKNIENERQSQELLRYYDKLLVEKEQWKKEVNTRRNKYHDSRQQYQIAMKSSSRSRISYSALSNEDIEFLKAKPNISKLVESQTKLHKSVKETMALCRRANELDDVILRYSEDKVNKITDYILENSTVESLDENHMQ
ncbi:unnamed protein product [Diatraea saccharalis]|uniref:Uncharacterized protein n=1 Tax=Diatraea saccharalis TaxID=40085 RepID=A0A9N9QTX5_9NEOP|nr:unnamed protein product [Diatraea saccharalis]